MKKRKLLIGFGLLALPVVLLCIVFQKQLAHTWKEVVSLTSNNPHEYRSRTLKRPVSFTNQMFLDTEEYIARNKAPNGEWIETRYDPNSTFLSSPRRIFSPYSMQLHWNFSIAVETRTDGLFAIPTIQFEENYSLSGVYSHQPRKDSSAGVVLNLMGQEVMLPREKIPDDLRHFFRDWPAPQVLEIAINPNLKSTFNKGFITLTNTGKDTIKLSNNHCTAACLILDENGRLWFLDTVDSKGVFLLGCREQTPSNDPVSNIEAETSEDDQNPRRNGRTLIARKTFEPLESYTLELPTLSRPHGIDAKLKASVFFVIVGENDKIIHIFETPCEK